MSGHKKLLLVLAFWAVLLTSWLIERAKTTEAFDYLRRMKIERVELRKEFDPITKTPTDWSNSNKLMNLIDKCLDDLVIIHDFRYKEDLEWNKIAFIDENQEHHIGYAVLKNQSVVLGAYYEIRYSDGETRHIGMGNGMKSSCLGNLIAKIKNKNSANYSDTQP
jgi:hypothetical protein